MSTFTGGSLLYIGALYDAYVLTLPEMRRLHGCFILTDAMPSNQYYKNITTEVEVLNILREEGGYLGLASDFTRSDDGSFEAMLADGCLLKYFFNVADLDAKIPQALLDSVKTLWIHGYDPEGPVVERLPNLQMVFASPSSMGGAYWAAREKLQTIEGDLLPEYNVRCAIPDVICWMGPEMGFDLRGDEGMDERLMASDAPFQFTPAGDDDDGDGDDDDDVQDGHEEEVRN
jgi:hypothetical protein